MNEEYRSITLLPSPDRGVLLLAGVACAGLGSGMSVLLLASLFAGKMHPAECLLLLPFTLAYLVLGLPLLIGACCRVHLVPEGIAVTLGNRTLRQYPVENIRFFFGVEWYYKERFRRLGVSARSPEEITALRGTQLKKGFFTRDEVKFRQRRPGWQQEFRQEYLLRQARRSWMPLWNPNILWLDLEPDTVALLRNMYPRIPWEYLAKRENLSAFTTVRDKDPTAFPREPGENPETNSTVLWILLGILILAAGLLWRQGELGLALLLVVGMTGIGLLIGWLVRGWSDMIHLSREKIEITRGKKKIWSLPGEQLRFLAKADNPMNRTSGSINYCLVISAETVEELALRQTGREPAAYASASRQLPGWENRALARYVRMMWRKAWKEDSPIEIIHWTPEREKTLRELYPQAPWLDITGDTLCK